MARSSDTEQSPDLYQRIWGSSRPADNEPHKHALRSLTPPTLTSQDPEDEPDAAAPPALVGDPAPAPAPSREADFIDSHERPGSAPPERNSSCGQQISGKSDDVLSQVRPVLVSLLARMTTLERSLADLISRVETLAEAPRAQARHEPAARSRTRNSADRPEAGAEVDIPASRD